MLFHFTANNYHLLLILNLYSEHEHKRKSPTNAGPFQTFAQKHSSYSRCDCMKLS